MIRSFLQLKGYQIFKIGFDSSYFGTTCTGVRPKRNSNFFKKRISSLTILNRIIILKFNISKLKKAMAVKIPKKKISSQNNLNQLVDMVSGMVTNTFAKIFLQISLSHDQTCFLSSFYIDFLSILLIKITSISINTVSYTHLTLPTIYSV